MQLRDGKHHLLKVQKLSTQPRNQQVGLLQPVTCSLLRDCCLSRSNTNPVWVWPQSKVPVQGSKKHVHRVFHLSTQLYMFRPDLCAFLPLDDMPSDLPHQLWSAVTALKAIDKGTHSLPFASSCASATQACCSAYQLLLMPCLLPVAVTMACCLSVACKLATVISCYQL